MEKFTIKINDEIDGPLDLLLKLIREKKMDLLNLDINYLTDCYIAYLHQMQDLHLEIASEYLVELATLMEMKSKKLIPGTKDETLVEEEDPRDRLVKRLLEYQQYKEASQELMTLYENRQLLMTKPQSTEIEKWIKKDDDAPYEGNPYELMKAMRRCLMRLQLAKPIETKYAVREISMEDRQLEIRAMMDRLPKTFKFNSLIEDCKDMSMFIATFLAILDLARQHKLVFAIDQNDEIWFSRGEAFA